MCNPKLMTIAAIGGALFTGGASLGLLGAGAASMVGVTGAAGGLTAMQGVSLAASLGGAGLSAAGAMQNAETQQRVAENNARTSRLQAESALAAGERDAQAVQRRASQISGAQRARMAANGLDITDGTPAALLDETDFFAAQDVATARNNAKKAAFNAQSQASGYQMQADGYSPLMAGAGSLLGSAGQVADKWYTYRKGA